MQSIAFMLLVVNMKIAEGNSSQCTIGEDWTIKRPIKGGIIQIQGKAKTEEAITYYREKFKPFIPETFVEATEDGNFQIRQRTIPNAAELGVLRLKELKKEVLFKLRMLLELFQEENKRGNFYDIKGFPREEFINEGVLNSSNIVYSPSEETLWFVDCADTLLTQKDRRASFRKRRKPLLDRRIIAIPYVAAKRFYTDYCINRVKQQRKEIQRAIQAIDGLL